MSDFRWGQETVQKTLSILESSLEKGLTIQEVNKRRIKYTNVLESDAKVNPLAIFGSQFTDTMVLVLLGATVISGIIGDMADAITIMAIVIINAVLGFLQEYRAERSLEEINKLASPYSLALRGGQKKKIPSDQLVPGDIVFIESGSRIPADIRLIKTYNLEIDEATLTGESIPVEKRAEDVLPPKTPLAEHTNMAFMGTAVTRGRGIAVVVETGMQTVVGKIAKMMKETETSLTPLQLKLDQLGKILIVICLTVCTMVTLLGILRGEPLMMMLMAGISLAVAAIPEGLPAIVTVVLALGVQRMAKRNAIIRKLPAVETLGCTTVICSDKTGTLTQNIMSVKKLATLDTVMDVESEDYGTEGQFIVKGRTVSPLEDKASHMIMQIAYNCNNSGVQKVGSKYEVIGDPTEVALLAMAKKAGIQTGFTRIREIPFDSARKMMSTVVKKNGAYYLFVKGALDVVIKSCSHALKQSGIQTLQPRDKNQLVELQDVWATNALRVLGFAFRIIPTGEIDEISNEKLETNLILVGICGMMDPPRSGVADSVRECLNAGIIPIMITGDHPATARAISKEIGISKNEEVITGSEIDNHSDEMLYKKAISSRVFARVSPEHKNRIIKVLKRNQHVVAMTGDGVNDAPALKAADIGVAMGITGTEVTKEASSMVLADDNFSTIVSAIYEGRAIYDNIRKFIRYLLGCNIGEILVMFLASILGMPLPLLPIQILWVNLVTDGLPAMALGLEPPEPEIMKRAPRKRAESIFARRLGIIIFTRGFYIGTITLFAFIVGLMYSKLNGVEQLNLARTMALTTLVFAQLFYVFECRSEKYSAFELGFFKNPFLLIAVSISATMHLLVIYLPVLQGVFKTVGLEWWQWVIIISVTGTKLLWKYIKHTWRGLVHSHLCYDRTSI